MKTILSLVLILNMSCKPDLTYSNLIKLKNNIFVEVFVEYGGATYTDYNYYFLTDSSGNRKHVGRFDDDEYVCFSSKGDLILMKCYEQTGGKKRLLDSTIIDFP